MNPNILAFFSIPYNAVLLASVLVSGTILFWPSKKYTIKAQDLTQKPSEKMTLLDVRQEQTQKIPRSKSIDLQSTQLSKQLKNKDEQIILISDNQRQGMQALKTLKGFGYTNILILDKGINGWKQAGLPLKENNEKN